MAIMSREGVVIPPSFDGCHYIHKTITDKKGCEHFVSATEPRLQRIERSVSALDRNKKHCKT